MQKTFKIMNFDHGYNIPKSIVIDDNITVNITSDHCTNYDKLHKPTSRTYSYDKEFKRIVKDNLEVDSEWLETAIIVINEENLTDSTIIPDLKNEDIVDDLCYLLSFFTGRIVCKKGKEEFYSYKVNTDSPVTKSSWIFYIRNYKYCLSQIKLLNLDTTFYNTLLMFQSKEVLHQGFLASANINCIYSSWWKKNKDFLDKEEIKGIMKYIENKIEKSYFKYLYNIIFRILKNETAFDIYTDIKLRVKNKMHEPSALFQLKSFLKSIGLFDESKISNVRIRYFNNIRNRIVHSGNLYHDKKFQEELTLQINISIISIMSDIIKFYFSSIVFNIEDDIRVSTTKDQIINYFENGNYNNMDIFSETYDEYLFKMKNGWIEYGELS